MIRAALAVLVLAGAGACEDRVPSPTGVLFAQYTKCPGQNPCTPEVVITNQNGAEVRRFAIRSDQGPCGSIVKVQSVPAQNEVRCPRLSALTRKDLSRFAWLSFRHRRSGHNSGSGLPCGLQSCGYLRDARTLMLRDHKFVCGRRGAALPGSR